MTPFRLLLILCFGTPPHPCVVSRPLIVASARECGKLGAAMLAHAGVVPGEAMFQCNAVEGRK